MKIKSCITILLLLFSMSLLAQNKTLTNDQISVHIGNALGKNYHPDSLSLSKLCRRACIFIKFRVNEQGQIADLAFSKDSATFIKDALSKAVISLQTDRELIGTLKHSGKIIIQPFIYDYQWGCNFQTNKIYKTKAEGDKAISSYYEIRDDAEHYGDAIFNMFNFSDGKLKAVDCILLSPFGVGTMSD